MSKDFFELFRKYNPLKAGGDKDSPLSDHTQYFYETSTSGPSCKCNCGKSTSSDEVFDTNSSTSLKRSTETEEILSLIDDMMKNPPMRGDIALSDLRRQILGDNK